jgi:hypothetical protein
MPTPFHGLRAGRVYEHRSFYHVRPGHAEQLREATRAFTENPMRLNLETVLTTGVHDISLTLFDNDTRFLFATTFDTEFDPYMDDSVALVGWDNYYSWLKHLEEVPEGRENDPVTADEYKALIAANYEPAAAYSRTYPNATGKQIVSALALQAAFQKVLDDPAAVEALANPALKPLLDLAAV